MSLIWRKRTGAALRHSLHMANRLTPPSLAVVLCCALAGCGSLLPRGSSTTPSPFTDFEHARVAAEKIVAFRTSASELAALGFDPQDGKNVTLIPYPDIAARLAPNPVLPLASLENLLSRMPISSVFAL
jgi:hypothetical protein